MIFQIRRNYDPEVKFSYIFLDLMLELLSGKHFVPQPLDANIMYEMLSFQYSEKGSNNYHAEEAATLYLMEFLGNCCCASGNHDGRK